MTPAPPRRGLPAAGQPPDEELLAGWRAGSSWAFDELVARYHDRLFGFLLRLSPSREDAEEAYSEAWLRVLRRPELFQADTSFRAWLFAIGRNCALDLGRRRRRWSRLLGRVAVEPGAARPPSAFERLEAGDRAQTLEAALRQVPEEHRAALLLHYRYDLDCTEVGAALGLTERQVRDRLSYGRRRMREVMDVDGQA